MPQMNFDLEDGLLPVSFALKSEDLERFMAFLAECEAGKRDAERYRWLKDPAKCYRVEIQSQPHGDTVFSGGGCSSSDGLDAAIDAAMALHNLFIGRTPAP